MNMAPRAYFAAPEDGAYISVDRPVVFEFGVEDYEITAVSEEVEQPRPDVGHDHLGVDTECRPVGEIIPMADRGCRWVTTSTAL